MNLSIAEIRIDGGTQPRAAINPALVDEYRADMMSGATFPPVTVFFDGSAYWLADGFHRVQAAQQLGQTDIATDVHQGTRRDAILYSVGANAVHGLRRTNEDKRRAVMVLLNDSEWGTWNNSEISRRCGVSEHMVRDLRPHFDLGEVTERQYVNRYGQTATMNTANIGQNGSHAPAPAIYNDDDDENTVEQAWDNRIYKGGLAYCKYCYKTHSRWELSGDHDGIVWNCLNCDHSTRDDFMELSDRTVDPATGEIFPADETEDVPFETSSEPQNGLPNMPAKPTYHAGNRSIGDQFHSKLVWNYQRLNLADDYHQFTIGYSQRSWEQFLELLTIADVQILMDVRRNAVSQYKPEFSKQSLQLACEAENLIYIHAPELGVDFEDRAELSETHDYDTLFDTYEQRLTPAGIVEAINKRIAPYAHKPLATYETAYPRIAYMCVEIDPCTCHRNRIAKALEELSGFTTFDL